MTCTLGLLVLPLLLAGGLASCGDTSPSSELSSSSSSHDANKALEKLGKGSLDAAWTKAPFDKLGKDAIEDDDTGDETSAENDEEGDTFEDSADDWSSAEDNSSTATDSTATGTDTATTTAGRTAPDAMCEST